MRRGNPLGDDSGSAAAEFVMVGALLTVLTLAVLQLGLALLVRNAVVDAASEGARIAALADGSFEDGRQRTIDLITTAVGSSFASDVSVQSGDYLGHPAVVVTVRAPLPIAGLWGIAGMLEATGHAAVENAY